MSRENQVRLPDDMVEPAARVIAADCNEPMWTALLIARQALTAALSGTTTEWGVRPVPHAPHNLPVLDRAEAERIVSESGYGVVISREVTEWREVEA